MPQFDHRCVSGNAHPGVDMLKSGIAAIVLTAGMTIAPSLALAACEGGKVLFEDKFARLNPAWGFSLDPKMEKVDATGYVADFPPNSARRAISQMGYFDDYVACVTITPK